MTQAQIQGLLDFGEITLGNDFTQLPSSCYRSVLPTPLDQTRLLSINASLFQQLGIDPESVSSERLLPLLSGNELFPGSQPLAMKYCGHQFGHFNPDLGDGRGLLLGEFSVAGKPKIDFHLKGAGQTPFSRFGDGRAVLRSTIREYLVGEALHHLGLPSTRALAMIDSQVLVEREQPEPAAILLRTAESHIRFGHFEFFYYSKRWDELQPLADYVIERHYLGREDTEAAPDLLLPNGPQRYRALLQRIIDRSADLVAGWQSYGFLHGVMNTDNMSIIGDAFDHGPFAFIDHFDWNATYNHTDQQGRYAFGNQPAVMAWNLSRLAESMLPLLCEDFESGRLKPEDERQIIGLLKTFDDTFKSRWYDLVAERLGLGSEPSYPGSLNLTTRNRLIDEWHTLLHEHRLDFNLLYRQLSIATDPETGLTDPQTLNQIFKPSIPLAANSREAVDSWLTKLNEYVLDMINAGQLTPKQRRQNMLRKNPVYILRTHTAQAVIDAVSNGDIEVLDEWLAILQSPFHKRSHIEEEYLQAPACNSPTSLSCSS